MTHPTETESQLSVASMADSPFRRGDNRGRVASPWKAKLPNFSREYEDFAISGLPPLVLLFTLYRFLLKLAHYLLNKFVLKGIFFWYDLY